MSPSRPPVPRHRERRADIHEFQGGTPPFRARRVRAPPPPPPRSGEIPALRLGRATHILDPRDPSAAPLWSTVSVEATTAALADNLSTALFCHTPRPEIAALKARIPGVAHIALVAPAGGLESL